MSSFRSIKEPLKVLSNLFPFWSSLINLFPSNKISLEDISNFSSGFQVRLDDATLTVSPFSGEAIISPTDKNDANDARKLLRVSFDQSLEMNYGKLWLGLKFLD